MGVTPFMSSTIQDLFEEITNGKGHVIITWPIVTWQQLHVYYYFKVLDFWSLHLPLSLSLRLPTENLAISFPEEDEIPEDAQDLVHQLMCFDPMYRLGSTAREGVAGVKSHPFFNNIDWTLLLRTKAEFIPQLRGEDDTSYFDGEKLELLFF